MRSQVLIEVVKYALTAVVGGWVVLRFSASQKASERRRVFRDMVSLFGTNDWPLHEPITFSRLQSSKALEEACIKIRGDIRWWKRMRFNSIFDSLFGPFSRGTRRETLSGSEEVKAQIEDMKKGEGVIAELVSCAK